MEIGTDVQWMSCSYTIKWQCHNILYSASGFNILVLCFAAAEEADDDIAAEGDSIEDEIDYVDSGVDEFNYLDLRCQYNC